MLALWLGALALTTLPLFGFGLYYKNGQCCRYREAREPSDVAYAYMWFFFGTYSVYKNYFLSKSKHYI